MRGTPSLGHGLASTLRCCSLFLGLARSQEIESVQLLQHKPMRELPVGADGPDAETDPSLVPASNYVLVPHRPVSLAEAKRSKASSLLSQTQDLFLVSNISPDEKAFAADSLQAIAESLLPALFEEHKLDQDLLSKEWQSFRYASLELEVGVAELESQRNWRDAESASHKRCRGEEQRACETRRACDDAVASEWEMVSRKEEALMTIDSFIRSDWCGEDLTFNYSTQVFRSKAYSSFEDYISRKAALDKAMSIYGDVVQRCQPTLELEEVQRTECEQLQGRLELANCRLVEDGKRLQESFQDSWNLAVSSYTDSASSVLASSENRQAEYTTILAAKCLLEKMYDVKEPCENATEEDRTMAEQMVEVCKREDVNTSALAIQVNSTPSTPLSPQMPAPTCSRDFMVLEYQGLPECAPATLCSGCHGARVNVSEILDEPRAQEDDVSGGAQPGDSDRLVDNGVLAQEGSVHSSAAV